MIVENESNWLTEDIEALLKSMMEQPTFELDSGIYESTLILFKTNCQKDKKDPYDGEITAKAPVADYFTWPSRYDDTKLIVVQSAKKLEMEPLDRLAHIGEVVQHMSATNLIEFAKTVWRCIARRGGYDNRVFDFTEKLNMRTRTKITRSKIAIEREISALYWKKQELIRKCNRQTEKLDEKSRALQARADKM